eukprot:Polyplicarium_translucidae@DN1171_c0_g1_i1.p1
MLVALTFLSFFLLSATARPDFAAVIDAGSTGTRGRVFRLLAGCGGAGVVQVPELSERATPGLGALWLNRTDELDGKRLVREHLAPLLRFIGGAIEEEHWDTSVVVFGGTAGIRQLAKSEQELMLDVVRDVIGDLSPVRFEPHWARILSGSEEASYSWVALNQLLGRMPEQVVNTGHDRAYTGSSSAALIEVGGASAQVVVEVDSLAEGAVKLDICGREIAIRASSYHGIGRQMSLASVLAQGDDGSAARTSSCLPHELVVEVRSDDANSAMENLRDVGSAEAAPVAADGGVLVEGAGDFAECSKEVLRFFEEYESVAPIDVRFPAGTDIVATENYFFFTKYIMKQQPDGLGTGDEFYSFTPADMREAAREICPLPLSQVRSRLHPEAAPEKALTSCFGLTLLSHFLSDVLGLKEMQSLQSANQVAGAEISWPVGYLVVELPEIVGDIRRSSAAPRKLGAVADPAPLKAPPESP